jgi:AcrR family transcriptional regulator
MVYRSTPKMQARKESRRRRFLDVATRLFGDRGYHRTTVPAVVARSGTSVGSFYMYFDNKEDLFAEVLRDIERRLAADLNAAIEARADPIDQMEAAVEGLFLFLAGHSREGRILLVESSGLGGTLERVRREVIASHTRGVEKALERLLPPASSNDIPILARCWVGAVHEAVRYWVELEPTRRRPSSEIAAKVARFNLRGIGFGEGAEQARPTPPRREPAAIRRRRTRGSRAR